MFSDILSRMNQFAMRRQIQTQSVYPIKQRALGQTVNEFIQTTNLDLYSKCCECSMKPHTGKPHQKSPEKRYIMDIYRLFY